MKPHLAIALGTAAALVGGPMAAEPVQAALDRARATAAAHQGKIHGKRRPKLIHFERGGISRGGINRVRRNKLIARTMMARHRWRGPGQFHCLERLWARESGWNERAHNSASGAHGIPQALPGSKMSGAGPRWRSNPRTQIRWGLRYIDHRYGKPCRAWGHFLATGWY